MADLLYTFFFIIALLILIEFLSLPDWIGRKLRGEPSRKDLEMRIHQLETRVALIEKKPKPSRPKRGRQTKKR